MKADEEKLIGGDDQPSRMTLPDLSFDRLKVVSALGRGAKGVVFLVDHESELLALKVVSKDLLEKKQKKRDEETKKSDGDEYRRVCFEQRVLCRLRHPLLPRLRGVLSDAERLVGYAIDYCPGRDLNVLRKNQTERMFSDDVIRFYAAELVLALEYLHGLGIVYRDLKPENIMIQHSGHIMIVDFDLSTNLSPISPNRPAFSAGNSPAPTPTPNQPKRFSSSPFRSCFNSGVSPTDELSSVSVELEKTDLSAEDCSSEKSNSFVGTEDYVAPEIVSGKGHDFAVDWWSLGVVLYEMLYGATPFRGANRKETFYRILTRRPELVGEPTALRDLIGKLLEKSPRERIGVEEIKGHDFFQGIDWESVVQISRPPHIPEIRDFEERETETIDVEMVVRGIFGDSEKVVGEDDNVNTTNKAWVQGLDNNADKFLVF